VAAETQDFSGVQENGVQDEQPTRIGKCLTEAVVYKRIWAEQREANRTTPPPVGVRWHLTFPFALSCGRLPSECQFKLLLSRDSVNGSNDLIANDDRNRGL
jgi:hypothetical protein